MMFLHVRGFAEATEQLAATEAVRRLNDFYALATDAVIERDGTLDKLLVEEVVAFFGAPYNTVEPERRAVEACSEVIRRFDTFLGDALVAGAVATGRAFVGNVGPGETRDYTAIGPTVTTGRRLLPHAEAGEILLDATTYAAVAGRYPDAPPRRVLLGVEDEPVLVRSLAISSRRGRAPRAARELVTILVLDLVDSTKLAAAIGDLRWRELLALHYQALRILLSKHSGTEVDTAGDGLLATFASPHAAIAFAREAQSADRELGLAARVGVHTGEVEWEAAAIRGIAVVLAARIAALGQADEVLVSGTVRELTSGSPWRFVDRGYRDLKGIPEPRQVFSVASDGAPTPN